MNEVIELCDRVIILNKGSIVANDIPKVLVQSITKVKITLSFGVNYSFDELIIYVNSMKLKYEIKKIILSFTLINKILRYFCHCWQKEKLFIRILLLINQH